MGDDRFSDPAVWLEESHAELASKSRVARRLRKLVEQESSTLVGVLATLAEQRISLTITTSSGWSWTGRLTAVSPECVVGIGPHERRVVINITAIRAVTTGHTSVTGDVVPTASISIEGVLTELSGMGELLTLVLNGPDRARLMTGTVDWSGIDLACLDLTAGVVGASTYQASHGGPSVARTAYVAYEHIEAVLTG
jgi:hypothetical protein